MSRGFAELYFFSTTLVAFQRQRGLTLTQMFLMESVLSAAIWVADLPTGVLADVGGRWRVLVLGRALGVAGLAVFAWAPGFWWFCAAEVVGGVGIACVSGCESALVFGTVAADGGRGASATRVFALLDAAGSCGLVLGLTCGSLIGAHSPALAVTASIGPAGAALLAAVRLRRHLPADDSRGSAPVPARAAVGTALRLLRDRPRLVALGVFRAAEFVLTNSVFWYNQLFFAAAGIPVVWFGPVTAVAVGARFGAAALVPGLHRRVGTRWTLTGACVTAGCCYAGLGLTRSAVGAAVLVAALVGAAAVPGPVIEAELGAAVPDAVRATALSAVSVVGALVGMALNPAVGRVGEAGLAATGCVLGGLLVLLGVVAAVAGRRAGGRRPGGGGADAVTTRSGDG